jgi:hypothetical protein
MSDCKVNSGDSANDPVGTYRELKADLRRVLDLPLEGRRDLFRDFLVGYLMVECKYPEQKAMRLVAGNEEAILLMLTEEQADGLW